MNPDFFNQDAQAGGFFPDTHINQTFDVDKFIQQRGKNSIIEGIRGTGKTHILKMVAHKYLENFGAFRVLPVYISLAKLLQFGGTDTRVFRQQLYATIVLESISCIKANRGVLTLSEQKPSGPLAKLKELFRVKTDNNFEQTIEHIEELNRKLLQRLTYNPQNVSVRETDTQKTGLSSTLSAHSASVTADMSAENEKEKTIEFIGLTLSHENAAAFIQDYFKELKEILSLSFSLILMDECSETTKEGQTEVFKLLKLIRGSSSGDIKQNFIYFIAAAYPPQATYYPSRMQGDTFNFDLGQDASVDYLQLDETLEEYENFFAELTKKRLQYLSGTGVIIQEPTILDIFDSEKAFVLAAYSANGIPRRYIEILKQAYDNMQQRTMGSTGTDTQSKISSRDVEEAIQIVVSNNILLHNRLGTKDFKILDEIVDRFARRNKKQETENKEKAQAVPAIVYFTTSRSQVNDLSNLIIQGALHDKARTRVRKFYREDTSQGELVSLDLAVAFYNGAIDKNRAAEIFRKDLKDNAKRGYIWCLDFDLTKFKAFKEKS